MAKDAAANDTEENVRQLGIAILSDEDPRVWEAAREIALKMTGKYGFGTLARRAKDIPDTGQVMRMALMEEFSRDRRTKWGNLKLILTWYQR